MLVNLMSHLHCPTSLRYHSGLDTDNEIPKSIKRQSFRFQFSCAKLSLFYRLSILSAIKVTVILLGTLVISNDSISCHVRT